MEYFSLASPFSISKFSADIVFLVFGVCFGLVWFSFLQAACLKCLFFVFFFFLIYIQSNAFDFHRMLFFSYT